LFDKLLGKKELEAHIRTLEVQIEQLRSENESTSARLASKDEITRKAISQKQVVEEELNSAKKKIETLEHKISVLSKDASPDVRFQNISSIFIKSMANYIHRIGSMQALDNSLVTAYLQPGQPLSDLENGHELFESLGPETIGLFDKIVSPTGFAVFYDTGGIVREALAPFLPLDVSSWQMDVRFDAVPLQKLMDRDVNLCVLIAHAGESFIGITDNPGSFTEYQIVRSSVKGKHTKGGWSQRRFERLRDEDIQHHVKKVKDALVKMIDGSGTEINFMLTGGESRLVSGVLAGFNYPVVDRRFDVVVDKKMIDRILKEVWSSKRYEM
jgi:chaperonin cofactor prefoldin